MFANLYLHPLDLFVKRQLRMRYYGRYVDDFVCLSESREDLEAAVPKVRGFLRDSLGLDLHPDKVVLEPVSSGIPFVGFVIRPGHVAIGERCRRGFAKRVAEWNGPIREARGVPAALEKPFLSSMNSYLGLTSTLARSYRMRKRTLLRLSGWTWNRYRISG